MNDLLHMTRYRIARSSVHIGLKIMPPSTYRSEVLSAPYFLHEKVEETVNAHRQANP